MPIEYNIMLTLCKALNKGKRVKILSSCNYLKYQVHLIISFIRVYKRVNSNPKNYNILNVYYNL